MKVCKKCGAQTEDDSLFCMNCGEKLGDKVETGGRKYFYEESFGSNGQDTYYPPYGTDVHDHTSEFDTKDISDNKVAAMLIYLMGAVGIIIALLISQNSPYVAFHVRQKLKFMVMNVLLTIMAVLFCWTVLVPIIAVIFEIVIFVIQIGCFLSICNGKAKEPAIIRDIGFLR